MHKFYDDLKEFILNQDNEIKKTLIAYFETLLQLESYSEMKDLLINYQDNNYTIDFNESDEDDYYSSGWFEIYGQNNSVSYTIELYIGDIENGFLPKVSILKEVKMINHEFQGHEQDLLVLEEKWLTEYEKELLHKKKLEKISSIEAQIEQLQKELSVVKLEF